MLQLGSLFFLQILKVSLLLSERKRESEKKVKIRIERPTVLEKMKEREEKKKSGISRRTRTASLRPVCVR